MGSLLIFILFCNVIFVNCFSSTTADNEVNQIMNLRIVQNDFEEVIIGWNLEPMDSILLLRYDIYMTDMSEGESSQSLLSVPVDSDDTSSVSLGLLDNCTSYAIEIVAYYEGGSSTNASIELQRPCEETEGRKDKWAPRNFRIEEKGRHEIYVTASWDKSTAVEYDDEPTYEILFTNMKTNLTKRYEVSFYQGTSNVVIIGMYPCSKYAVAVVAFYREHTSSLVAEVETLSAGPKGPYAYKNVVSHDTVELLIDSTEGDGCVATRFLVQAKGKSTWDDVIEEIPQFTTTSKNITLTGLYPGTNYEFQINSQNDYGTSKYSWSGSGTTLDYVPTAPLKVEAFRTSNQTVTVKWSPPAQSFGILRNYWIEITSANTDHVGRVSSSAKQMSLHSFTPDDLTKDLSVTVWAENSSFNGTKSLSTGVQ